MSRVKTLLAAASAFLLFAWPVAAEKRVALVVGNASYASSAALANPANDAEDMAGALKAVGFEVILGLDLDKRRFRCQGPRLLAHPRRGPTPASFFYAGHGLQVSGRNYLVPVDAQLQSERDLDFEAVGVDFVLKQMELEREGKTNIVFLDACRDNPLARNLARSMGTRSAGIGRGLAQVQAGVGTFIAYSTQPGNVALDGAGPQLAVHGGAGQGRQGARAQSHRGHDRRAQGGADGDRRQAGAVGPFGADRRFLFPPCGRARRACPNGPGSAATGACRSGCASSRSS